MKSPFFCCVRDYAHETMIYVLGRACAVSLSCFECVYIWHLLCRKCKRHAAVWGREAVPSGAPVLSHRPQTKPHHSTCVCVGEIEASRLFAHVFRPLNVSAGRGRRGSGGGYSPNPFDDVDDESDGISAEGNGCLFFFRRFYFVCCMLPVFIYVTVAGERRIGVAR